MIPYNKHSEHTKILRENLILALIISLSMHIGLFLIFFMWNPYDHNRVSAYTPRAIKGYLIEDSSFLKKNVGVEKPKDALPAPKVEIPPPPPKQEEKTVTIPEKKTKEISVPKEIKEAKKEPVKKAPKKEEKIVVEPDAIEKLKELQNLFNTGEENTRIPRKDNFSASDSQKKGRGIPDADAEGVIPSSELEFLIAEYAHNLKNYIVSRWLVTNLKALKANPQAIAYVYVTIDRKGNLLDIRLKQTSGIRSFDEDCINTIKQAEPLIPPPEKLIPVVVGREIQFECPAEDVLKSMGSDE